MSFRLSDLDLQDLLRQGQSLYRQQKYGEALQCFDKVPEHRRCRDQYSWAQAVSSSADAPLTVYDHRAATLEKLNRPREALRDGRLMIERNPSSCKGYLRTGKVLQILQNSEKALDIYQLGLRREIHDDGGVALLRRMSSKLAKLLAPVQYVDPFTALPLELAEETLSYLCFRQMVNLLRVSRRWHSMLRAMPHLWMDLDLSTAKYSLTLGALRQYIKHARGNCTSISLNLNRADRENILAYAAKQCKDLRQITIVNGYVSSTILKAVPLAPNLQSIIITSQCEISLDTVEQVFAHAQDLGRAEFHRLAPSHGFHLTVRSEHGMRKLRELTLNASSNQVIDLDKILSNIPVIQVLSLRGWHHSGRTKLDFSHLRRLEKLDIAGITAVLPPGLPESLRVFDCSKCTPAHYVPTFPLPDQATPNLPCLESLSIALTLIYPDLEFIKLLDASKGKLKQLHASSVICKNVIKALIIEDYLTSIEDLKLREVFDDELAILLARSLPRIRRLDLSHSKISGVGIKALITGLKSTLQWLGLDQCRNTSIDAVEFARSMNIKVSYGFTDHVARGKRIRLQ